MTEDEFEERRQQARFDLLLWVHQRPRGTNFTSMLYSLIAKADSANRARLAIAYPLHMETFREWQAAGDSERYFKDHFNAEMYAKTFGQELEPSPDLWSNEELFAALTATLAAVGTLRTALPATHGLVIQSILDNCTAFAPEGRKLRVREIVNCWLHAQAGLEREKVEGR